MPSEHPGRAFEVLLIEDNPGDARLAREALRGRPDVRLSVATDGDAGLDFLRRRGAYAAAPRPDLVLLDLNLPGTPGREVLTQIKADGDLRRIPVVVLTSSQSEQDVRDAYDLHANCFVTKPEEPDAYFGAVRAVAEFWLGLVRRPRGN
jgi:CheY-like chemotaxis protein